ncbi:anthranilate synthase component II [Halospeciosus flavus]|uniref:anthranilate synthase n=1 Tax=Halospeciosus flavus TaxID=3032283 RepID=A0ABD5Z587_9EURY|nr:aminodeoxychorismate/anthranilate synthase component II [Halospeciosus flavus]
MTILVVDNYDSFVYNLVQYVGEVTDDLVVRRNDRITLDEVRDLDPEGVVVSPGPGTPREAGISMDVFDLDRPVLGVCLGHQALCAVHGAEVVRAPEVVHGKSSTISHDGRGVFDGLPDRFEVGRYHSLAVEREDLPEVLEETATTDDDANLLMAVRHREKPHVGVQFHPESILTGDPANPGSLEIGKRLVRNFVEETCSTT